MAQSWYNTVIKYINIGKLISIQMHTELYAIVIPTLNLLFVVDLCHNLKVSIQNIYCLLYV